MPTPAPAPLTISDNGIGMSRDGADREPGHHRPSGTRDFLETLKQPRDEQPPGADRPVRRRLLLRLHGRRQGRRCVSRTAGAARRRACAGSPTARASSPSRPSTRRTRGTDVILHLKADAREFLDACPAAAARSSRYSDFIELPGAHAQGEARRSSSTRWSTGARRCGCRAARSRPRSTRSSTSTSAHDFTDPLAWSHYKVEGKREFTALLYVPAQRARSTCGSATRRAA